MNTRPSPLIAALAAALGLAAALPARPPSLCAGIDLEGRTALGMESPLLALRLGAVPPLQELPDLSWVLRPGFGTALSASLGMLEAPSFLGRLRDPLGSAIAEPSTAPLPWPAFTAALSPAADPLGEPPSRLIGAELRMGPAGLARGKGLAGAIALYGEEGPEFLALGLGAKLEAATGRVESSLRLAPRIALLASLRVSPVAAEAPWLDPERSPSSGAAGLGILRPSIALDGGPFCAESALLLSLAPWRECASALESSLAWTESGFGARASLRVVDPSAPAFTDLEGSASGSTELFGAGLASVLECRLALRSGGEDVLALSLRRSEGRPLPDPGLFLPLREEASLSGRINHGLARGVGLRLLSSLLWKADYPVGGGWEGRLSADFEGRLAAKTWGASLALSFDRSEENEASRSAVPLSGAEPAFIAAARASAQLSVSGLRLEGRVGLESGRDPGSDSPQTPLLTGALRLEWDCGRCDILIVLDSETPSRLCLSLPLARKPVRTAAGAARE